MNPALGLAEGTYTIGMLNRDGATAGTDIAKYIWVYIAMPFIGAIFAAVLFILHSSFD
jgi:glycerol uptake facilitator-like aquaporin